VPSRTTLAQQARSGADRFHQPRRVLLWKVPVRAARELINSGINGGLRERRAALIAAGHFDHVARPHRQAYRNQEEACGLALEEHWFRSGVCCYCSQCDARASRRGNRRQAAAILTSGRANGLKPQVLIR
jgi:hypothetical protein